MKRAMICLVFFMLVFLNLSFVSAVIITEVEMSTPEGAEGIEWIELYNNENNKVDISDWTIHDNIKERYKVPNGTVLAENKFYIIEIGKKIINDKGDIISIYDNEGTKIYEVPSWSSSKNDDMTWQLCDGSWDFKTSTKGSENKCEVYEPPPSDEENPEEENDEEYQEEDEEGEDDKTKGDNYEYIPTKIYSPSNKVKNITFEPISLNVSNPKDIKMENEKNITEEETQNYPTYTLIVFCFLLGILFMIKNRKNKNEFR